MYSNHRRKELRCLEHVGEALWYLDIKRTCKKWQLYRWRNHRSHRSQSIEYKNHRRHPSQSIRSKNHRSKELRCLEHAREALWYLDIKRTRKKWQLYRWRNHRSHRSQSIEYKNHRRHPSQSIRSKNHRSKELRCLIHEKTLSSQCVSEPVRTSGRSGISRSSSIGM